MGEIERLQEHLLLIRRGLGWTAVEFGEKIGVTRQTINNLEANDSRKAKLSKTQYLAIRKVIEDEFIASPDDMKMIQSLLEILVDHPDQYPEAERQNVVMKAGMIAPSILAKSSTRTAVSEEWITMISSGALGTVVAHSVTPLEPNII